MLRKKITWFPVTLLPLVLLLLPLPLAAATYTFELDPATTKVEFTFGATLHTVDGMMRAKGGTVRIDPETNAASGRFVLDATSAQTGNSRRDQKMHEKILESQLYPEIAFEVQRVSGHLEPVGRSEIELSGILEMHGTKLPMAMPVVATSDGTHVTGTGMMIVPYLKWGLRDPSFFILRVEKEVRIKITAIGSLKAAGDLQGH
ncbi:MAG TPA: YceI family protein [Thermoanaerobaculia bacterium]|jgi:polyisoprenoid-binding protein YceI|nr:YceI family protein [Thermoanaerobaculia bacterium]